MVGNTCHNNGLFTSYLAVGCRYTFWCVNLDKRRCDRIKKENIQTMKEMVQVVEKENNSFVKEKEIGFVLIVIILILHLELFVIGVNYLKRNQ